MKKTISFILLAAMLQIPCARAEERIFYSESYENTATNDVPEDYTFVAENVHVVERGKGEKAAEMTSADGEAVIERSFDTDGENIVVQFDMALWQNDAEGEIQINNGSGKYITVLTVEDSKIFTHDGKEITACGKHYKTISLCFDLLNKRYSVVINGKCELSKWYFPTMPEKISGMKINLMSEQEFCLGFDNLSVFAGKAFRKFDERPQYNDDIVDFVPSQTKEESSTPIVNTGFEQGYGITGVSINKADNNVEVKKDTDGNGYVSFQTTTANGCYIDIPTDNLPKNLVVEFDVKGDKGAGGAIIARGESATFNFLVNFNTNQTISIGSGKTIGKFSEKKWTNVKLILNFKKHTMTAYTDGKLTAEGVLMGLITDDTVGRLRIGSFSGKGELGIDNLLIYQGKTLKTFEPKDPDKRELIFESDQPAKDLIGNGIAIHVGSGTIYKNGEKEFFWTVLHL